MKKLYSNGKLLLTGEYLVLDGALALAIPTNYGQSLKAKPITKNNLFWKSIDYDSSVWFQDTFYINKTLVSSQNNSETSKRLIDILQAAQHLNSNFLKKINGFSIETKLDFPKNWGLGSSSTLINNIAQWANIDAYKLLELTFGGSGYDIACAQHDTAITYQLKKEYDFSQDETKQAKREITAVDFYPSFSEHLYFVYLNQKQNSREGIKQYKTNKKNINLEISEASIITKEILSCDNITSFNKLLSLHEKIIGSIIKEQPIKERLFSDFNGAIKSLGAWGGDFILISSTENPTSYFKKKGFETIVPFKKMVLSQ